ncbi:hypothetical protein LC612_40075 [Nostoc sp. CHAB 5834]|nr:hypothetical protein [Nostoc sp. CHAB 5834]
MSDEYCCEHSRAAGRIEKTPKFLRYGKALPDPRNWKPEDADALFELFAQSGDLIKAIDLASAMGVVPMTIRGGVGLKWDDTALLLGDSHKQLHSKAGRGGKVRFYSREAALLIVFRTSTREAFAFQAAWVNDLAARIGKAAT